MRKSLQTAMRCSNLKSKKWWVRSKLSSKQKGQVVTKHTVVTQQTLGQKRTFFFSNNGVHRRSTQSTYNSITIWSLGRPSLGCLFSHLYSCKNSTMKDPNTAKLREAEPERPNCLYLQCQRAQKYRVTANRELKGSWSGFNTPLASSMTLTNSLTKQTLSCPQL